MPDFSSPDYVPESDRLRGALFILAWAALLLSVCAFWGGLAWAVWYAWRLAGGE